MQTFQFSVTWCDKNWLLLPTDFSLLKITQTDWKNVSFHAPASAQHNQSRLLNERTWEMMMMNYQLMANLVQSRDPSMWVCDKALYQCALELRNIATYLELNLFLCSKWSAVDNMLPFTQTEMRGVIYIKRNLPYNKVNKHIQSNLPSPRQDCLYDEDY